MTRISASILGFYFEAKAKKQSAEQMVKTINDTLQKRALDYQILHLDIEDGKFVEQKSFAPAHVRKIKAPAKREAHLMVIDYKKYIKEYFALADLFIVHHEIIKHDFQKTIDFLKKNKKYVGIAINPGTPVNELKYLDQIDVVLVMSVEPGLPGQKFIETSIRKIKKLNELRKENKHHYLIEVDGGINDRNKDACIKAGADILVMGTGLFR